MAIPQFRPLFTIALVTALSGAFQPAWASLSIAQSPLTLPQRVKPAFIMALDNSGSIGSDENLCTTSQGECTWKSSTNSFFDTTGNMFSSGQGSNNYVRVMRGGNKAKSGNDTGSGEAPRADKFGAARDPEFNRAYFNPGDAYTPWVNFDGSPYLGSGADGSTIANFIDQTTGNAVPSSAPEDARHPLTATNNGGSGVTIDFTTGMHVLYTYSAGDVLPKGTNWYYTNKTSGTPDGTAANDVLDCAALKATVVGTPANGTLETLAANYTIGASCNGKVTVRYYPATVYLTTKTAAAPDAVVGFNLANVITVPKAGPYIAGVYTDLYKYEIIPANFPGGATDPNYVAVITNFANYWTYFGDRARAIVGATTQTFGAVDFMRVGKFDISPICSGVGSCSPLNTTNGYTKFVSGPDTNYTSQPGGDPLVTMYDLADYVYKTGVTINPIPPTGAVYSATGGDRYKFYQSLYAFDRPNNNTPTRRSVYRMGHQFQRVKGATTVDGVVDNNPPILLACQINAGMLFTDGYINDDNGGLPAVGNVDGAMGAPFSDAQSGTMSDIAAKFYNNNLRPDLQAGRVVAPLGCPDPTLDCQINLHMNFFGVPLGAIGHYYDQVVGGVSYVDDLTTTADEATAAAFANPPAWLATGTTNLQPSDVDDIWHASINSRGKFISAQSPARVRDGIKTIINTIIDATLGSGSSATAGARLGAGSITYQPSFAVAGGSDWTGNLKAYQLTNTGGTGTLYWSAAGILNAESNATRTSRNIVINKAPGGSGNAASLTGASALGASEATQLGLLGTTPAAFHLNYGVGATVDQAVAYLKGDSTNELTRAGAGNHVFRYRSGVLGDIVDSSPELSTSVDDFGYAFSLPSALGGGATYTSFLTSKALRSPSSVVYVGANDGMLHAFDGRDVGGGELFGFIPYSITNKLNRLLDPAYSHYFYVDGGINVHDAYLGGAWKTVLVGSTGAGGSGVFALDVTTPGSFGPSKVMWEVTNSDPDIGSNIGRPTVFLAEDDVWYAAFGNGYNSTNSNPGAILVNLSTGAIKKVMADDGGNFDNGIGYIAPVDLDGNGKIDHIYGGDYQGNVWKFKSSPLGVWSVDNAGIPLYVAKDASGNRQPITGDIEVGAGPITGTLVYFGTGSFFLDGDNSTPSSPPVQTLYGIWDNGTVDTLGRASLVQQTISSQTAGPIDTRALSSNPIVYTTAAATRGFYVDLEVGSAADGEKFFGRPLLQDGVVLYTTFEPATDACSPGGTNWEYGLDALSGASALNNLHIGSLSGGAVCPGGSCGAMSIGTGAPVRTPTVLIPPPPCIPGVNCPIPVKVCDPDCHYPPPVAPTGCPSYQPSYAPGSRVTAKPAACGRQSWRQVR